MFALEVRSSEGELWVRRVGDYFGIAHTAMDIMDSTKFIRSGWVMTIKGTTAEDHDEVGSLEIF